MSPVISSEAANRRVSVVVTTTGRDELTRAIASVQHQTVPPLEIICVDDRSESTEHQRLNLPADDADTIRIVRSGGQGANRARNIGIDMARGEFIALLDDDDYWLPEKLERQLKLVETALDLSGDPHLFVLGCQALVEATGTVQPRIPYSQPDQDLAEWLFCPTIRGRGAGSFLQTSGIVFSRAVRDCVQFDETLPSHQDWDWAIRASRVRSLQFRFAAEALYVYSSAAATARRLSDDRLRREQQWATRTLEPKSRAWFGYFIATAAPKCLASGKFRLFLAALYNGARRGRFDFLSLCSFGADVSSIGAQQARRGLDRVRHAERTGSSS